MQNGIGALIQQPYLSLSLSKATTDHASGAVPRGCFFFKKQ